MINVPVETRDGYFTTKNPFFSAEVSGLLLDGLVKKFMDLEEAPSYDGSSSSLSSFTHVSGAMKLYFIP